MDDYDDTDDARWEAERLARLEHVRTDALAAIDRVAAACAVDRLLCIAELIDAESEHGGVHAVNRMTEAVAAAIVDLPRGQRHRVRVALNRVT